MAVNTRLQVRNDTAANWTSANPTLLAGELGFETDTGKFKIGDGSTKWNGADGDGVNKLPYQNASGATGATGPTGPTGPTGAAGADAPTITSINAQTGTTYTLVLADKNKLVELNNSASITVTVPDNTTAFDVGSTVNLLQTGTGQVIVSAASGVTLNYTPGNKLRAQWSSATLIKRATNTWVLIGDTTV